ncbi:hypothetical protein DAEQUDRAFT_770161 [Daedalea quercina L-15889]|uniref:FAD-binding domain-containing protein n=1 Tax=Daedalea quercina L-15889 TaxID=1314783 RepID=A0A165L3T0_9APHY|nr:hypothetical protein DAEQUDRAFT_770161 [Daedalea quercina L-15889]
MGIEDAAYAVSGRLQGIDQAAWCTSCGPDDKKIADEYSKRTEPEELNVNPEALRFRVEITDVQEYDCKSHAILKLRYKGKEPDDEVRARFAICADGERSFTDKLGEPDVYNMVTGHFRAPMSTLTRANSSLGSRVLVVVATFGPASYISDLERFDSEAMSARIRGTLHLPDLPSEILTLSPWHVNAIYAERYHSTRRVFLDAANLVWKLNLTLQDEHRYDAERRPVEYFDEEYPETPTVSPKELCAFQATFDKAFMGMFLPAIAPLFVLPIHLLLLSSRWI